MRVRSPTPPHQDSPILAPPSAPHSPTSSHSHTDPPPPPHPPRRVNTPSHAPSHGLSPPAVSTSRPHAFSIFIESPPSLSMQSPCRALSESPLSTLCLPLAHFITFSHAHAGSTPFAPTVSRHPASSPHLTRTRRPSPALCPSPTQHPIPRPRQGCEGGRAICHTPTDGARFRPADASSAAPPPPRI